MYVRRHPNGKFSYFLLLLVCGSFLIAFYYIQGMIIFRQYKRNTIELPTLAIIRRVNEHDTNTDEFEIEINVDQETNVIKAKLVFESVQNTKNNSIKPVIEFLQNIKSYSIKPVIESLQSTKSNSIKPLIEEPTKPAQNTTTNFNYNIIQNTTKSTNGNYNITNTSNHEEITIMNLDTINYEEATNMNLNTSNQEETTNINLDTTNHEETTNMNLELEVSSKFTPEVDKLNDSRVITPGCTIPEMDAWDPSIMPFIFEEKEIICNNGKPPLFDFNETSVFLLKSSLQAYQVDDVEKLKCCYKPFQRSNPFIFQWDDKVRFDPNCYGFNESATIEEHEFVKVSCLYNEMEIYKDFFYFIRLKESVKERDGTDESLNVLVVGIDGVSRLNFLRQMPKTVAMLETIGAVPMYGFNKIDDNSFPNQVPILTGLTAAEVGVKCWPLSFFHFDDCPFIWNDFKKVGYETVFSEDAANMGLFYLNARGFVKQPTDHYWNTFNQVCENEIGSHKEMFVTECMGSRPTYKQFLGYTSRLVDTLNVNKKKYFAYLWGSAFTHDFLNKAKLGDEEYVELLKEFSRSGVLNNTALFFMSDHGIRYGDIRATYQGMMEERLPLLYISLPEWYKEKHALLYNNLKSNQRRLITPLDIHETIKDLLNSQNLTNDFIKKRDEAATFNRSYSLFQNITSNRTCEDAGISSHWCTCQSSIGISSNNSNVVEATEYTIGQINDMLSAYSDCAKLELDNIIQARLNVNNNNIISQKIISDYTITFKTNPGGALFEATVRKQVTDSNVDLSLAGAVSRINIYGNQSACLNDKRLKLYCYCKT